MLLLTTILIILAAPAILLWSGRPATGCVLWPRG